MRFLVPVKTMTTEIFRVEARNAEEAMNLALDGDDVDHCRLIEVRDGDSECYYPDIYKEEK